MTDKVVVMVCLDIVGTPVVPFLVVVTSVAKEEDGPVKVSSCPKASPARVARIVSNSKILQDMMS